MGHKETFDALQATVMMGDYEGVRDYVADYFVLHQAEVLPYGGEFIGPQGFVDLVHKIGSTFEIEVVKAQFSEAAELLVCELEFLFTSRRTGERQAMAMVDLYRFGQDGKLISADIYYKDAAQLASIA